VPIYLYECRDCGETEEHIQKFADEPLTECAACGGRIERVLSPSAAHFKGGGWAKDGYASTKKESK
jgi:putative FmdB family regulatory protein